MRWALGAGLLVALIVIASPVSALDHQLLTFHMVQHLVLMTIAAPLILAGIPATAKLQRSRAARLLLHPVSCWLAGTGVVLAWHVPAAHQLTMSSPSWHLLQQVSFLAGGLLFWHPVMARGPMEPLVPVYLLLATFPCDALSAFLAFCGRVVYGCHPAPAAPFGLTPLQDQQCAGALMWFWVTIAYLVPAVAVTLRLLSPRPERKSLPGGASGNAGITDARVGIADGAGVRPGAFAEVPLVRRALVRILLGTSR